MSSRAAHTEGVEVEAQLPGVSVIVPVKDSQRTILGCVEALLAQDYEGPVEIILVGDVDDPTWGPIEEHIESGDVVMIETRVDTPARDANAKRNMGLWRAAGEILAMTDSDMVMPPEWIATGVALLRSGWECVGGEMRSVDQGLWNRYIDTNPIASKTPRMDPPYTVTAEECGAGGHKLPITANVLFTRNVLEAVGGFDADFVWSYEDYEFFARVAQAGFPILCTSELTGGHHHRQGVRRLVREYRGSGRGCAQFIAKYPRSRFTRQRLLQLAALCFLPAALLPPYAWLAALVAFTALMAWSAVRARHAAGLLFPLVTFALGMAFTLGLAYGLLHAVIPAPRLTGSQTLAVEKERTAHEQHELA